MIQSDLTVPLLASTAKVDEVMPLLREYGCVRIRSLVDDETMERVEAELLPLVLNSPGVTESNDIAEFLGYKTRRVSALMAHSRTCGQLAMHPLVMQVAERVLEEYQLHVTQAVCLMPGETVQPLHRDDLVYPIPHPMRDKEIVLNTLWAVRDYSAEVGATRAVPGSHKWDDVRQPLEEEACQAIMPRGSVLIYYGSTYHGGGANLTENQMRFAVAIGYSRNWLRQEENQYLAVPPHIARDLPEPLQRLIGYSLRHPFLGWVDLKDPHLVLERSEEG